MLDNQNQAGGQTSDSSGTDDNQTVQKKDVVSYETHRKLLEEKKKRDQELREAQERIQSHEDAERKRQEDDLAAKGEYKKMLELRDAELKTAKDRIAQVEQERLNAKKMRAFLSAVSGEVNDKYYSLIPYEDVIVKEDGSVDEMSVTKLVENFQKEYPEVIRAKQIPGIPNNAPNASGGLTHDEWLKLPAKEMARRLPDVIKNSN